MPVAKIFETDKGQAILIPNGININQTEFCIEKFGDKGLMLYPETEPYDFIYKKENNSNVES
ncbi:MAG: hypothetical protein IJM82_04320 [Synergistaceae bacterium]|nr:hypothetical protein [Synergistaceae bacterium]MBQ7068369.1 hypothetical protein [Synergistaceae bacterium]MBR0317613.1 hypothetical protein [Synergistaceae bacterium]